MMNRHMKKWLNAASRRQRKLWVREQGRADRWSLVAIGHLHDGAWQGMRFLKRTYPVLMSDPIYNSPMLRLLK